MFGRRERVLKRVLVVEDEPLVAFDNEHLLRDAGYEVVATVDGAGDALKAIEQGGIDLVLADLSLSDGDGAQVARAAHERDIKVLFVTGSRPDGAAAFAVGALGKPYSPRDLLDSIAAVEAKVGGKRARRTPRGLTLFG